MLEWIKTQHPNIIAVFLTAVTLVVGGIGGLISHFTRSKSNVDYIMDLGNVKNFKMENVKGVGAPLLKTESAENLDFKNVISIVSNPTNRTLVVSIVVIIIGLVALVLIWKKYKMAT